MENTEAKLLEELTALRQKVDELTKKEAEHKQQAAILQQYENVLTCSRHAIVLFDKSGNLTYVNAFFLRLWGYNSAAEVLGRSILTLWQEKEKNKGLFTLYPEQQNWTGELQAIKKDKRIFDAHVSVYIVRTDEGEPLNGLVVMFDSTGSKQLEEQLYYSRKMEAVGRLAGSIAHDFNNILMIVISFSDLVLSDLEEDHPSRSELEEIKKAGERGAAITRRLLTFSARQPTQQQLVDPVQLIDNLTFLIRSIAGEAIKFEVIHDEPGGFIKIDNNQIEQAIINLVLNARDAMPQGGTLTVRLAKEKFEIETVGKYPHLYPGEYLVIAVSDTGCGMDEQVKANIFEPFFSTKANGGTGLGLATAYGFIRQNKGIILFDTSPGKGSTFKIYLPWLEAASKPMEKTVHRASGASASHTGTIMVVEDHDPVRKMIRQSLHTSGYQILEAANAEEALAICRSSSQAIELLISDIIMPGKSGLALVEELHTFRPLTKVLFISGYRGEHELASCDAQCKKAFLLKPFSADTLLKKVREVLTD